MGRNKRSQGDQGDTGDAGRRATARGKRHLRHAQTETAQKRPRRLCGRQAGDKKRGGRLENHRPNVEVSTPTMTSQTQLKYGLIDCTTLLRCNVKIY